MSGTNLRKRFDRRQTAIFCEGKWDSIKSRCECSHCILLNCRDLQKKMKVLSETKDCRVGITSSAAFDTAIEQLISAEPPPYTTRLSTTRLRTAQMAS